MSMKSVQNKVLGFFEKIGKRNMMIAGAVVLIAAAVLLNWMFFHAGQKSGYDYSQGTGSQGGSEGNAPSAGVSANDEYYSSIQISRQRARDEALEVLQSVVDNKDATEEVKAEALAEMQTIAAEIAKEANIETLVESKGFAACVTVLNGDSATVIVSNSDGSKELSAAQLAQINTIVYEQAKIEPKSITIQVR